MVIKMEKLTSVKESRDELLQIQTQIDQTYRISHCQFHSNKSLLYVCRTLLDSTTKTDRHAEQVLSSQALSLIKRTTCIRVASHLSFILSRLAFEEQRDDNKLIFDELTAKEADGKLDRDAFFEQVREN